MMKIIKFSTMLIFNMFRKVENICVDNYILRLVQFEDDKERFHVKLFENNIDSQIICECDIDIYKQGSYLKEDYWLYNLSTSSELQNKGYGSKFLQLLFQSDFCKGKRIALSFTPTPLRTHFYRKNMDMIVRTDGSYWYAIKDC